MGQLWGRQWHRLGLWGSSGAGLGQASAMGQLWGWLWGCGVACGAAMSGLWGRLALWGSSGVLMGQAMGLWGTYGVALGLAMGHRPGCGAARPAPGGRGGAGGPRTIERHHQSGLCRDRKSVV